MPRPPGPLKRLPEFDFAAYYKDTRVLSRAARGDWMDLLCQLSEAPVPGRLTLTISGWSALMGLPVDNLCKTWGELVHHRVADFLINGEVPKVTLNVTRLSHDCHAKVTVINRRMFTASTRRIHAAKRQQRYREQTRKEA